MNKKNIFLIILIFSSLLSCGKNPSGPSTTNNTSKTFPVSLVIAGYFPEGIPEVPPQEIEYDYIINDNNSGYNTAMYSGGGKFIVCKTLSIDALTCKGAHYRLTAKNTSESVYLKISAIKNNKEINGEVVYEKDKEIKIEGYF
jgi:hypothetical protein